MADWQFNSETNSGTFHFEGGITIGHVAELKERLVEALNSADKITLDVSEVNAVDIAGVQLLCACHRYCREHGKTVSLANSGNAIVFDFLDGTGFSRNFGCNGNDEEMCLWDNER